MIRSRRRRCWRRTGRSRPAERPLWLGSVKSNIGHTQAAAGVAGVIKMVLAMRHGVLPRTLHVDEPSPHVDWSAGAVELLTEARAWPEADRPRRAGVSSFGVSGTNAHVILEQAPDTDRPRPMGAEERAALSPVVPWVVSAHDAGAVREQAARLGAYVIARDLDVRDVAASLVTTRTPLSHRAVVLGSDREALLEGLAALAEDQPHPALTTQVGAVAGPLAMLFAGQGSQYAGMGRELYEGYSVFRDAFDEVCSYMDAHCDGDLREVVLFGDDSEVVDATGWAQPALFAFEVALYRLLRSWGAEPDYVMGHSIGELTAAYTAGVWSLPDACAVVAARGRLMQALPSGGAMYALQATEDEVLSALADTSERLSIAAVNGPMAVVISGDEDAVTAWQPSSLPKAVRPAGFGSATRSTPSIWTPCSPTSAKCWRRCATSPRTAVGFECDG